MERSNPEAARALQQKLWHVIGKAWADDDSKDALKADPVKVLADHGVDLPEGHKVTVSEESPTQSHLVIPVKPTDMELSDFQSADASWCWSANMIGSF